MDMDFQIIHIHFFSVYFFMIIINLIFNFMFNNFTDTELSHEQWRDIDGYDGMYQVSSFGRVRSLKFGKVRVMRTTTNLCGYLSVGLSKDGKQKLFLVHRLVAQAFIANDNILNNEINHRNEIKTDNRVSNLEWCDRRYNNTYNDIQFRKKTSKRRKIEKLYNPDLTIKQNIEVFRTNGIECGRETVRHLRRDLGLTKHYRPRNKK